jgi:hypothetical protein
MKNKIGQQTKPYKKGGKVDKETPAELKKFGKEGSKSEEKHDKKEMKKGGKC